jgi:hypothetical protein
MIGSACQRMLEATLAGSNSAVTTAECLQALTLPHTFRLPVPALPAYAPSVIATAMAEGPREVARVTESGFAEATAQMAFASIGVIAFSPGASTYPDAFTVRLPVAGLPVSGIIVDKSLVVSANKRRHTGRIKLSFRVGRDADLVGFLSQRSSQSIDFSDASAFCISRDRHPCGSLFSQAHRSAAGGFPVDVGHCGFGNTPVCRIATYYRR